MCYDRKWFLSIDEVCMKEPLRTFMISQVSGSCPSHTVPYVKDSEEHSGQRVGSLEFHPYLLYTSLSFTWASCAGNIFFN